MRDLEFLPDWYPMLRRKRRLVILETWLAGAVVGVLGLCMILLQRNVQAAGGVLGSIQGQMSQADLELQHLSEMQSLKRQMSQQAQILTALGLHVPTARLINAVEAVMPEKMALLDFTVNTDERTKPQTALAAASGAPPQMDRHLHIRIHGVVPTDADLGDFLGSLASIPYFSDIAMPYSRPCSQNGHTMREFEVTFAISLNVEDH